jgi:Outer membrane protein beta-barrel domain
MKKLVTAVAALVALVATPALAQEQEQARKFQITPYAGAFIPTGDQRDVLDDAFLTGLTLSYDVHPYVSIVGSFGWAGSQGKQTLTLDQDLDVFQYDLGVQGQYPFAIGKALTLKPFLGAGLGARTYDFRDLDYDTETDFVGYLSAGADMEYRQFVVGLTVRDYIGEYDGIGTDENSSTRNDIALFASVGARF